MKPLALVAVLVALWIQSSTTVARLGEKRHGVTAVETAEKIMYPGAKCAEKEISRPNIYIVKLTTPDDFEKVLAWHKNHVLHIDKSHEVAQHAVTEFRILADHSRNQELRPLKMKAIVLKSPNSDYLVTIILSRANDEKQTSITMVVVYDVGS